MKTLSQLVNVGLLFSLILIILVNSSKKMSSLSLAAVSESDSSKSLNKVKYSAADSVIVNKEANTVKLYGKAYLTNGLIKVNANYIEYNSDKKSVEAAGDVVMYDFINQTKTTSSKGYFSLK